MSDKDLELEGPEDDKEQTFVAHLVELRSRIVRMAVAILLVFACLSPFMKQDFRLPQPTADGRSASRCKAAGNRRYRTVYGAFEGNAFRGLFIIALPYVLWQMWGFIAPVLYRKEKRLALPIIILVFGYVFPWNGLLLFPSYLGWYSNSFAGFSPDSVNFAPDIDSYFGFILALLVLRSV